MKKTYIIPQVGSLDQPADLVTAVKNIQRGQPIVFQFRRVIGICIDGSKPDMVKKLLQIKKKSYKNHIAFSAMITTERFLSYIDQEKIHPKLLPLVNNPDKFKLLIGSISHLRAPIKSDLVGLIPSSMISYENNVPYLHHLDTSHHLINQLVSSLDSAGIKHIAVSTLNLSHIEPEITHIEPALNFCSTLKQSLRIPLILSDPTPTRDGILGSFPIIDISLRPDHKLSAVRAGHIPFSIISQILDIEIDLTRAKPPAYPQIDFSSILSAKPNQLTTRNLALAFIHPASDFSQSVASDSKTRRPSVHVPKLHPMPLI
jgi:hypothetical protein